MTNYDQIIVNWITQNLQYSLLFVFLIAFLESFAIVGLIIPGSVTLSIVGILIGAKILPLYSSLLCAMIGAFCGDITSFFIGRLFHENLYYIWPFRKFPKLIHKGKVFFINHGKKSIFVGRFIGPIRPILPLVAGMLKMPIKNFITVDIISGLFWAPAYMLPGAIIYLTGFQYFGNVNLLITISLSIIILAWFFIWLIQLMLEKKWPYIKNKLCKFFVFFFQILLQLKNHFAYIPMVLSIMCLLAFIYTFIDVLNSLWLSSLNVPIYDYFHSLSLNNYYNYIANFALISNIYVIIIFYSIILLLLLWQKHFEIALIWYINGAIAGGSATLLKSFLPILRPVNSLSIEYFSFPSAHVTLTISIYGLFYLLTKNNKNKYFYSPLFLLLVIAILMSRLLLSVHWFTDVLAGVFFGLSCLLLSKSFLMKNLLENLNKTNTLTWGLPALLILWSIFTLFHNI